MKFKYENQGSSSFMLYDLEEGEILDEIGLGMIANNKIQGIVPVSYMQINNRQELRFNISSRISLESLLGNIIARDKILSVFASLCDTLLEAEGYLMEDRLFLLDRKYIFADVSTGQSALVYLPVLRETDGLELKHFFKELIFTVQSDPSDNTDYVARIINELNKPGAFQLTSFRTVIYELKRAHKRVAGSPPPQRCRGAGYTSLHAVQQEKAGEWDSAESIRQPQQSFPADSPSAGSRVIQVREWEIEQKPAENEGLSKNGKYRSDVNNLNIGSYQADPSCDQIDQKNTVEEEDREGNGVRKGRKSLVRLGLAGKAGLQKGIGGLLAGSSSEKKEVLAGRNQYGFEIPGEKREGDPLPVLQPVIQEVSGVQEKKEEEKMGPQMQAARPEPLTRPVELPNTDASANKSVPVSSHRGAFPDPAWRRPDPRLQEIEGTVNLDLRALDEGTRNLSEEDTQFGEQEAGHSTIAFLRRQKTGEEARVTGNVFHIGRAGSFADFVIRDNPTISKNHADIMYREGDYFIVDTNSKNRTYLNGQVLTSNEMYPLKSGDTIRLSNENFEFKVV